MVWWQYLSGCYSTVMLIGGRLPYTGLWCVCIYFISCLWQTVDTPVVFNCWLVVVPCVFLYIITLYESIFPCCGDNMHSLYFYFGDPLAEVHTHTIQDDLNIGRLGMWSMPDGEYNVSSDEFLDSCNIPDVTQMDSWRYHLVFVTVSWPPVAINSPEKRSGFFCASFIVS